MRRLLVGPLVCVALALVVVVGFRVYRDRTGTDRPRAVDGVLQVRDAVAAPVDGQVVVTGYVFIDRYTGDLLCSERTKGDPPACEGEAATLQQLDPSRLDLVRADPGADGYDAWSRDAVVLQVRTRRATFVVEDVLPGPGS